MIGINSKLEPNICFSENSQDKMSSNVPSAIDFLMERAILLPVDMNGSLISEYGDPPMNGFEPATILALISKTLNSS